ncbi:MAG: hypothetical protein U0Q16_07330 [Bryobacteraceae bacterium]
MRTLLLMAGALAVAEVVDRTAVIVDRDVITTSAIDEQLRISAFLDSKPLDLTPANRRRMAERMVEQVLIRREMRASHYAMPAVEEADKWMAQLEKERADFAQQRAAYGVSQKALRTNLLLQLASLRFIELRFRPGTSVTDGEIEIQYRDEYVPEWQKKNPGGTAPELDEVREEIEAGLVQKRVDQALDQWLGQARGQAKVEFLPEAFQ